MIENVNFDLGNIISLVLIIALIVVFSIFFAKKKSIKLLFFYVGMTLLTAGFYVLSWFYDGMDLGLRIMDIVILALVFIIILVYQNDFKVVFARLTNLHRKVNTTIFSDEELQKSIEEIVKATQILSKARTGALMVIVPKQISDHILDSGVSLDSLVTAPLLESIFNTRAPMHDGAVIIKGNKILSAGCFLPLSQTPNLAKDLGTRHRAAVGITEESDNISVVVSEETGIISVSTRGVLRRFITPERLSDILHETFGVTVKTNGNNVRRFF
jgi:diadenylate cyclase